LNFIFTVAFSMMQITAALFWEEHYAMDESNRGLLFGFTGLSTAIVQGLLVGKLNKRFGERKLLYIGLLLMATGLIIMPLVPRSLLPVHLVALALIALANGCFTPSIFSLLSHTVARHEQGKYMGLNQSAASLARVIGPALGGFTYAINYHAPYFAGALLCLLSIWLVRDLTRNKLRSPATS
ncbi:MAG TPA: MFS transporter, partial [Bacteroidia bacterium]|nr:MFS transporter [Bacteroidia bacterium]